MTRLLCSAKCAGVTGRKWSARKTWRCAGWRDDFSVTSGTIFAFHKLRLRLYVAAVILFANAVKGFSALQVGRDLGVSHKTAYVLLHKIGRACWGAGRNPPCRARYTWMARMSAVLNVEARGRGVAHARFGAQVIASGDE